MQPSRQRKPSVSTDQQELGGSVEDRWMEAKGSEGSAERISLWRISTSKRVLAQCKMDSQCRVSIQGVS